jgi:hypothetical protein
MVSSNVEATPVQKRRFQNGDKWAKVNESWLDMCLTLKGRPQTLQNTTFKTMVGGPNVKFFGR